jgi:hypothetical protein
MRSCQNWKISKYIKKLIKICKVSKDNYLTELFKLFKKKKICLKINKALA